MMNCRISIISVCLINMVIQTYSNPDSTWVFCGNELDDPVSKGPFTRWLVMPPNGFYTNYSDHIANMNPDEKKIFQQWPDKHFGFTLIQLSIPSQGDEFRRVESICINCKEIPTPTAYICPQEHGPIPDQFFEMLTTFPKIKHVELFDLKIGDGTDNYGSISKLNTLEYIGLPYDAKDEHLQFIANLPNLHFLNASGTELGGDGLQCLHSLPKLRTLDLRYTKLKSGSLKYLSKCPALETLLLSESNINDRDILDLIEIPNLKNLTLHQTSVTSKILNALVRLKTLKLISLYNTKIGQTDIDKFLRDRPDIQLVPRPMDHRNFLVSRFYILAFLGDRTQQEYRAKGYLTKDPVEALKWFLILAEQKDDDSFTLRKSEVLKQIGILESQLDTSQIEEARRRAEVFQFLSNRATYRPEIDMGDGLPIYQYELQKEE